MGIRPVVLLVIYRTEVEVCLQLAVRALYLTDEVVIVPCGLLVERLHVGTQEVCPIDLLLGYFECPGDSGDLVLCVFLYVYVVVSGDGGIAALKLADALQDGLVPLRAALLLQ